MPRRISRSRFEAETGITYDGNADFSTTLLIQGQNNLLDLTRKIEASYGDRIYMSLSEVAMLIGLSTKTLRQHALAGTISYALRGFGRVKIRRSFTARDVARFCARVSGDNIEARPPEQRRRKKGRSTSDRSN
ncbi:hypothetical protein [Methylobacterium brachiatum]|uniref:hypothetical protein n=1 Tax=Methylobacterium brachiatum TaxID=269660 RepID=UPI0011140C83|nr:hypothetical protein [Methylobacterium brachiatum]